MNATHIELRCKKCMEVVAVITDEIQPDTEAIARSLPLVCFWCNRLTLHRGEPVERRMPYADE